MAHSLRDDASFLWGLIERLPAAVYACDAPSGKIVFYNAKAVEIWGREPRLGETEERFCGSFRLWRPDGAALPHDETPMAAALREGRATHDEEVVIERPDGRRTPVRVHIHPVLDAAGRVVCAINVFHEATTSRRDEETRARLAAIVESSDDAIVSKDLNGIITSWNLGAERLFGYTAAEAVGRPVTIVIPPDRHDEEPGILERVRRGERVDHYETVRRRKDGELLDISLTISPILDDRGKVIGASKIARDITERKRAEAQRAELLDAAQRAREEAEAANRAKDEFLAMLGHELRNPLFAVRSAIVAAVLDEANRDRALDIARRQTDQLGRIVEDLLDVARITRGRVPLRKERIALGEVLRRTAEAAGGAMEERGHALALSLPAEEIHVVADPARLEQAVGNLLTNAAKYTDPGGRVEVVSERDGAAAVVRVRDNGMGISPEMLPRVFELFAQGERALDRAQGGLGIGLTLVRRIVELHGGAVEARSPGVGRGAEFVVRLPALPPASQETASAPAPARDARPFSAARVLVVEDDSDAADGLVMILEVLGHRVRAVRDGVAALETARRYAPDVMLVDIGLPGMDGYDVARAVRGDPALGQPVLVALTGYGRSEDKARALAAGFDHHVAKPVDLDTLADLFARLAATAPTSAASGADAR